MLRTDIEHFIQIISYYSHEKNEPCAASLVMLQKRYLDYLYRVVRPPSTEDKVKNDMLRDSIHFLEQRHFFHEKMDSEILKWIKEDCLKNGEQLRQLICEDEREEFLETLKSTIDENIDFQTRKEPTFTPIALRAGTTQQEKQNMSYSLSYQSQLLATQSNNKGCEHYSKREWAPAIACFEQAVAAEEEMSVALKRDKNELSIAVYQRNIALAYSNLALDNETTEDYSKAIQCYQSAINSLNKIPDQIRKKNDEEKIVEYQRKFYLAINKLGIEALKKNELIKSAAFFQEAIAASEKINQRFWIEQDKQNVNILRRNCILVFEKMAMQSFHSHQYENAIRYYLAAMQGLIKIGQDKTPADKLCYANCMRWIALSFNARGLVAQTAKDFATAKKHYEQAMKWIDLMDNEFVTQHDKVARQIYQNNFNGLLVQIEAVTALAKNQSGFFKRNQESCDSGDRPLKRRRQTRVFQSLAVKKPR